MRTKIKQKKSWLNGKTVLITGASSGIGKQLCQILISRYGCKVIGIARRESKLIEIKDELGTEFEYYPMDVSQLSNWQNLSQELDAKGIAIDVLINNAGIIHEFAAFEKIPLDKVDDVMSTNFNSVVYGVNTFLDHIKQCNGGILNISSAAALSPIPGMSIYCASKSAIYSLTMALAREVPKGTYVGVVCPGFIKTELFDAKGKNSEVIKAKDRSFVNRFSMSTVRAATKIAHVLHRKRKRATIGLDSKVLSAGSRLMPNGAVSIMGGVMRMTHLESFEQVFDKKKKNKE